MLTPTQPRDRLRGPVVAMGSAGMGYYLWRAAKYPCRPFDRPVITEADGAVGLE